MILAGPPAVAMTYVNESSGLEPSLYGGGGSPSSKSLLLPAPSLVSRGSAALVSATAALAAEEDDSWNGGAGAKAGSESTTAPVMDGLLETSDSSTGRK